MKRTFLILSGLTVAVLFYLFVRVPQGSAPSPLMDEAEAPESRHERNASDQASRSQLAPPPSIPEDNVNELGNTLMHRLARGDTNVFKLLPEQIQAFLAKNKTNAESLLAAFNVTADPEWLREAARRYPSNPLVLASVLGNDASPEHRRELIDQFKQVSNDNSLPNYLSAREYLRNQQPQQAFQELAEAAAKGRFNDYTTDRAQGLEDLYLSSGYSPAEAKALSTLSVQEPALPSLRDLARELSTIEGQYATAGDSTSVAAIAKLGLGLSADIKDAGTKSLASQMLSASAERDFLAGLDPNGMYDFIPQPIGQRLAQLRSDRINAVSESKLLNDWMTTATEPQLVSYYDRMRLYGEAAALKWARTQTGD